MGYDLSHKYRIQNDTELSLLSAIQCVSPELLEKLDSVVQIDSF